MVRLPIYTASSAHVTILLIVICAIVLYFMAKHAKKERELIAKLTMVRIVSKKTSDPKKGPQLMPALTKNPMTEAGTRISDDFIVVPGDENDIKYFIKIEGVLENGKKIRQELLVSKKCFNALKLDEVYPLEMINSNK